MISVSDADRILHSLLPEPTFEFVPLDQAAGRVLATPLRADRDGPPYDRVAMDGYAIDTQDGRAQWEVRGLQCAGRPPLERTAPGVAIEVATGAVLPGGCDAVIRYEDTIKVEAGVRLKDGAPEPRPGRHVHHQGTDYRRGDTLLAAGTLLRSPHLHSLASAGADPVEVVRRARWALAATGDELVEVRDVPQAWQIRRSNAAAIVGEASTWGLAPGAQAILADDRALLLAGLKKLLPALDVLVLTGGVSAGVLDLIPGVLAELGAEVAFHKLAQRPGKPLWCGRLPGVGGAPGTVVFGLPGNPVSSLFSFRRYVLPWLLAFEGNPEPERRIAVPGGLPRPEDGQTVFLPWSTETGVVAWKGSGDYSALGPSSGFVEVTDERSLREPRYYPWGGTR